MGWGLFINTPLWGKEIKEQSTSIHNERLATVDSGYIDMLVRFGVLGTGLLIISFVIYCVNCLFNYHRAYIFIFLMSFLAISLTWSVLTYSFGLAFIGFASMIARYKETVVN